MTVINNVNEAWQYYHAIYPGYNMIGNFTSQSRHGGTPGVTHLISIKNGVKEYLTRKTYWASAKLCKVNNIRKLPSYDRHSPGETIKTQMLGMWQADLKSLGIRDVMHVTIMDNSDINVFDCKRLISYILKYDSFCDHEFTGPRGAVYYPQRLAEEYLEWNTIDGPINRDEGQTTL